MEPESTVEQLRQQVLDLRRAVAERDEFVSVVAHELRNPVSPLYLQIAVMTDTVAAATGDIDKAWLQKELGRLATRVDYFLRSLNRLLDVTQIDEGRIELHPEPQELVAIVRASLASFPELQRFAIEVTLDGVAELEGVWDRLRIEQIVGNLVSNAIRYGARRPIHCTVDLDTIGRARLRIRDHGVGIAATEVPRIFEKFRRVGDVARASGFGIGLWVVAELCHAMKGEVLVESELGAGTTFTVLLPRTP